MKYDENEVLNFKGYMYAISSAALRLCIDKDSMYYGVEGAKRLGRECGVAIADFKLDPQDAITSTYSGICVRAYNLRPPIDNKEWCKAMWEGYNREIESRKNRRKENETQLQEA